MTSALDALYKEVILDHFKNPRCKGCIENPTGSLKLFNPLCGDQVYISLNIKGEIITELKFEGQGCSISQASASMVTSLFENKTISEAKELIANFKSMMRGEKSSEELEPILGDVIALEGVRKFSARVKCAVLVWEAVEKILEKAESSLH